MITASKLSSFPEHPETLSHGALIDAYNQLLVAYQKVVGEKYWSAECRSSDIGASHKLVLEKVREEVARRPAREDGLTPLYIPNIVEATGLSDDTVGKAIKTLSESGILTRKLESKSGGKGSFSKVVLVSIPLQTEINPGGLALKEGKKHGGLRLKLCIACGGVNLEKREIHTCRDCGEVLHDARKDLNDPELLAEMDGYEHPKFEEQFVASSDVQATNTPETYAGSKYTYEHVKDLYLSLAPLLTFEGEYRDKNGFFIGRSEYYSMLHDEIKSNDPTRINTVVELMENIQANGGSL